MRIEIEPCPGPWHVSHESLSAFVIVDTKDGHPVAEVLRWDGASRTESEANAHLIAASPEMLVALQVLVAHHGESGACENCKYAETVIARAKGRKAPQVQG